VCYLPNFLLLGGFPCPLPETLGSGRGRPG